ncbi:MAG: transketolase [Candidatus Paceibacterota bacterium]
MSLTDEKVKFLQEKALDIRRSIIESLIEAKSGHTAGPLDMTDIFTYLYFHALKHDPKNPSWEYRDRLVLSNGHICPVLYATMAHAGYFPVSELMTLRKFGSRLQGHPHREWLPMLENSSGPLGSGLSQAVGMAIADRMESGRSSGRQFYCLMGDGELDAGNNWEAAMLAAKEKIQNLTAIVDRNNIQIDGFTEDIMPLNPLADKWRAWNWHVIEIDGHNFRDIDRGIGESMAVFDKPTVIIANTIASKGIPAFERQFEWHGKPPTTPQEIETARDALK